MTIPITPTSNQAKDPINEYIYAKQKSCFGKNETSAFILISKRELISELFQLSRNNNKNITVFIKEKDQHATKFTPLTLESVVSDNARYVKIKIANALYDDFVKTIEQTRYPIEILVEENE